METQDSGGLWSKLKSMADNPPSSDTTNTENKSPTPVMPKATSIYVVFGLGVVVLIVGGVLVKKFVLDKK